MLAVLLTACGGGNDAPAHYALGGSVSGLAGGTLMLQVNDGETVSVSADGTFQFPTELPGGTAYVVSVQTQPNNPAQTCSVNRGSGTLNAAVNDIAVRCATNAYRIGGTVSGLVGTGLVLQNNGGDDLAIDADRGFRFTQPVASGAAYVVTVRSQPDAPAQTCTVNQSSTIVADTNVTDVRVQCDTNSYPVGGSVSGLGSSGGLVLQNNGTDDLGIDVDGDFQFQKQVASGADYTVTVRKQPSGQVCSVEQGSGTIGNSGVTDVQVECSTAVHAVKVTVSGYSGSGLTLLNNGGDALYVEGNGSVSFPTPVAFGKSYEVTVASQPSGQFCSVSNGSGTIGNTDVTNVQVTCSASTPYTIGGTITGLSGKDANLVLQNNGGDDLVTNADGSFTFPAKVENGRPYKVTIKYQPRLQANACTVSSNGSGTVTGDVSNIAIDCSGLPALTKRVAYVSSDDSSTFPPGYVKAYVLNGSSAPTPVPVTAGTAGSHPSVLVADPQRQYAYVAASTGMEAFTIDRDNGGVTQRSGAGGLPNTDGLDQGLAMHPGGKFIYLVRQGTGSGAPGRLYGFSINRANGFLTNIDPDQQYVEIGTDYGSVSPVIDPTGRFLYIANSGSNSISIFTLNENSGKATFMNRVPHGMTVKSLVIDPTGRFLYAAVGNLTSGNRAYFYKIDPLDGGLSSIGPAGSPESATSFGPITTWAMDPTGGFLYAGLGNTNAGHIYRIGSSGTLDGNPPPNGSSPSDGNSPWRKSFGIPGASTARIHSFAVDPIGDLALSTDGTTDQVALYRIDRSATDGSIDIPLASSSTFSNGWAARFVTILGW